MYLLQRTLHFKMSETAFIPTKCSSLKRKAEENFQVVVFESHKPKEKPTKPINSKENTEDSNKERELNIKKVKHDIVKFAMSGLEGSEKEEAKVKLAIKLGAKPKKNKYKNYKELKEEKQKERNEKMKEIKLQELGKDGMGRSSAKTKSFNYKRKDGKGGLLSIYGKVTRPEVPKVKTAKKK